MNPGSLLISGMNSFCTRRAASLEFVTPSYRRTVKYALLLIVMILRVTYVLCYLPGRGRLSRHAFGQRNQWTACRFQDYFNARPQPPGLSGTVTFTLPYRKSLERLLEASGFLVLVSCLFSSSSSSFVLVLGLKDRWIRGRGRGTKRRERLPDQSKQNLARRIRLDRTVVITAEEPAGPAGVEPVIGQGDELIPQSLPRFKWHRLDRAIVSEAPARDAFGQFPQPGGTTS